MRSMSNSIEVCASVQTAFSSYLDGAVSGREMQHIAAHLDRCRVCSREFAAVQSLQEALSSMGSLRAPADLGMRLRLAISHEQTRTAALHLERFGVRWRNIIQPLLLQASAGFAGAVVLVGGDHAAFGYGGRA